VENSNIVSKHGVALLLAVFLFLVNQLPFLEDMRPVMYDEAWYSNTAYNLCIGNGLHQTSVGSGGNSNCIFPIIGAAFLVFLAILYFLLGWPVCFVGY
jgi:hypothetical protein